MCKAEIQNKREVEGELELVHLQLVPVDCGKDYTHREREREGEMHRKQWLYLELVVHGGIDKQFP